MALIDEIKKYQLKIFKTNKFTTFLFVIIGLVIIGLGVKLVISELFNAGFPLSILGFLFILPFNLIKKNVLNNNFKKFVYNSLFLPKGFIEDSNKSSLLSMV